jgi:hypothetical protein
VSLLRCWRYVSAWVLEPRLRFRDDVMSPLSCWNHVYAFLMMLCLRLCVGAMSTLRDDVML